MNRITFIVTFIASVICLSPFATADEYTKPNVIIILADDLGYGDLSCYGATVHQTPHIDSLANQGLRFTQGFATSATCTPSRYALMTGNYPCRREGVHILPGDAPLIINPDSVTLPKVFKKAGYTTGIVGKWHLGLGQGKIDWNSTIKPGPNEVGFDSSFIMAATVDRTPTVYIRDGNVVNLDPNDPLFVNYKWNFDGEPTYHSNPELVTKQKSLYEHDNSVHNGVGRIGYQKGGVSARWVDETMAEVFKLEAERFIRQSVTENKPFFLYYALHQPHVPRMPSSQFADKSPLGLRGDVILEADWQVGELMKLLDELHLTENTLIIFTSDNGPVLNDGYAEEAVKRNKQTGHKPSGNLRGGKYSDYCGGAQVPFIVYWSGKVKSGTSDALVCHVDFLASFADALGVTSEEITRLDSQNVLPALLGQSKNGRTELLVNGITLRTPRWQFFPTLKWKKNKNPELYDMTADPSEQKNVWKENPNVVKELRVKYDAIKRKE